MTNITWIGNSFFAKSLERPSISLHCADCPVGKFMGWQEICAVGGPPDILVVADKSVPPFVLGMEDFPCLTVLYVVDSHIHSWFPYYAQGFDFCLVSLKDHLPRFKAERLPDERIIWLPPYYNGKPISPDEAAAHDKLWDILFVGTMNPRVNPERIEWLDRFTAAEARLHTTSGDYQKLNVQARLILNHSILGDLNFRVFETLGTGVPLFSPRLEHGLSDLFTDGTEMFLFDQSDVIGAARRAGEILNEPDKMLEVAWSGYNKVTKAHMASHRADQLLRMAMDSIESGQAAEIIAERQQNANKIRRDYLRLIYLLLADSMKGFADIQEAYLAAASKSD